MKENLRTTHYSNGTSIPLGDDVSMKKPYRYYPDNNSSNVSTYGYLYNWPAVMHGENASSLNPSGVQGICPNGWHVPSESEWTQMTTYVSSQQKYVCGNRKASDIAKSLASTKGWKGADETCTIGNNPSANNATGFTFHPSGEYCGKYYFFGKEAFLWTTTVEYGSVITPEFIYDYTWVYDNNRDKYYGLSVRCLRN